MKSFTRKDTNDLIKRSGVFDSGSNFEAVHILVNTHLSVVNDVAGEKCNDLLYRSYISLTIKDILDSLDTASSTVIQALCNGEELPLDTSRLQVFINWVTQLYTEDLISEKDMLLLLRYPLRLSLEREESLGDYKKFLESNLSCKTWENFFWNSLEFSVDKSLTPIETGHPSLRWQMLDEILDVASELVLPKNYEAIINKEAHFSSGSTLDCGSVLAYKYKSIETWETFAKFIGDPSLWLQNSLPAPFKKEPVKVMSVPKNAFEGRTIAAGQAVNVYWAHGVRAVVLSALEKTDWQIDFSDQQRQRCLTHLSSYGDGYATIDSSSASDRVPWEAIKLLFPKWEKLLSYVRDESCFIPFKERISRVVPNYPSSIYSEWFQGDKVGISSTLFMYSTAGNPSTFVVETSFFYCVCEGVRRWCSRLACHDFLPTMVYGDDVMVDQEIADITVEILTLFNVKVNLRKSFSNGFYRESCGAEYWKGYDVSTSYFPRGFKGGYLNQVISLQHALFRFPSASAFLTDYVRRLDPRMTAHVAGTPCTDLWSVCDEPELRPAWKVLPFEHDGTKLPEHLVKVYKTFIADKKRTSLDLSANGALYREALHGQLIEELPEFWNGMYAITKSRILEAELDTPSSSSLESGQISGHYKFIAD